MLEQLHFLEPFWLFALIPLGLILWKLANKKTSAKAWASVIDANLLPLLLQGEDRQASKFIKWLLGLAWLISVVALADPVWEKIPRPVFQTNTARVIVLDLSNSMLVDDLKPTRMARARFKIEDILAKEEEGQIGLVVFAGDAFTASPLTRDSDTIRALLQVLTPSIMPSQGSRVDLGLEKAHELLTQAGVVNGEVLLITDGASNLDKAISVANSLKKNSHKLSVLAVGTETGGQLQLRRQPPVNVKLDLAGLNKIAKKGGGVLHTISSNDADLQAVLKKDISDNINKSEKTDDFKSEDWKSSGPFIILLLLPLAALAFRKGWLFNIVISMALLITLSAPQPLMAASSDEAFGNSLKEQWKDFFQNKEQKADKAFQNKEFDKAINLSENPLRKGSAEYKKGNYQNALETFQSSKSADARYNEGNTLAKLKKYEEAIKAYDKALEKQPDMADAKANKKAIEEFLKKQQEQSKDSKSDKKDKKENKKDSDEKKDGEKSDDKQDKGDQEKQEKQDKNNQNKQEQSKEGKDGKEKEDGKGDKKENQFSDANKQLDKKSDEEEQKESGEKQEQSKDENAKNESKASPDNKNESKIDKQDKGTKAEAETLNKEEKMAAEQWLRRIPDDPGGLLRRKFKHQYRQRKRQDNNEQPW